MEDVRLLPPLDVRATRDRTPTRKDSIERLLEVHPPKLNSKRRIPGLSCTEIAGDKVDQIGSEVPSQDKVVAFSLSPAASPATDARGRGEGGDLQVSLDSRP
eukprot:2020976-Rhodomonas_salina.2